MSFESAEREVYCSHCGKELREAAAFCIYCGTPVARLELLGEQSVQMKSDGKKAAVVVGVCVGVAGLMFFLTMLALLLPAVSASRESAQRMRCINNEKLIGLALHNYHDARGALPPLYTVDNEGNPLHSWRVLILPYIGQEEMYKQIKLDEPWDSEHNKQFHDRIPIVYVCPSRLGNSQRNCTYSAVSGWAFVPAKKEGSVLGLKFEDIIDGLSNTLALVEVKEEFNWMNPTADITLEDVALGNRVGIIHPVIVNTLIMDGSVRGMGMGQLQKMAEQKVAEKKKVEIRKE